VDPFYAEDLAYVHHVGYAEHVTAAGTALRTILSAAGLTSGLVVDLGCGGGLFAQQLLAAGYQALGIDLAPAMIDLARRTAPAAEFRCESLFAAEIPECTAVAALGEALNYCVDETPDDDRLRALFARIAARLRPGGLFAFDVLVRADEPSLNDRNWKAGADWAVLVAISEQPAEGWLEREIIVFREVDGHYRRSEERHRVRVFDSEHLTRLLSEAGFEVEDSTSYGALRLRPRRRAFLAWKPRTGR